MVPEDLRMQNPHFAAFVANHACAEEATACCHGNSTKKVAYNNKIKPTNQTPSLSSEPVCRICLEAEGRELISPCSCSGSLAYVHEKCLIRWFTQSGKKTCEVCLEGVELQAVGYKPFHEWRLPREACDFLLLIFLSYILIMAVFCALVTWIATQRCTTTTCICLYGICGTALVYLVYYCVFAGYPRKLLHGVISANTIWKVQANVTNKKEQKQTRKKDTTQKQTRNPTKQTNAAEVLSPASEIFVIQIDGLKVEDGDAMEQGFYNRAFQIDNTS